MPSRIPEGQGIAQRVGKLIDRVIDRVRRNKTARLRVVDSGTKDQKIVQSLSLGKSLCVQPLAELALDTERRIGVELQDSALVVGNHLHISSEIMMPIDAVAALQANFNFAEIQRHRLSIRIPSDHSAEERAGNPFGQTNEYRSPKSVQFQLHRITDAGQQARSVPGKRNPVSRCHKTGFVPLVLVMPMTIRTQQPISLDVVNEMTGPISALESP